METPSKKVETQGGNDLKGDVLTRRRQQRAGVEVLDVRNGLGVQAGEDNQLIVGSTAMHREHAMSCAGEYDAMGYGVAPHD